MLIPLLVIAVFGAGIVAAIAVEKGRSGFGWFVYGFLLLPVAIVHALAMSGTKTVRDEAAIRSGRGRKCPACAEVIKAEAIKCRYCGTDVAPVAAPRPTVECWHCRERYDGDLTGCPVCGKAKRDIAAVSSA